MVDRKHDLAFSKLTQVIMSMLIIQVPRCQLYINYFILHTWSHQIDRNIKETECAIIAIRGLKSSEQRSSVGPVWRKFMWLSARQLPYLTSITPKLTANHLVLRNLECLELYFMVLNQIILVDIILEMTNKYLQLPKYFTLLKQTCQRIIFFFKDKNNVRDGRSS